MDKHTKGPWRVDYGNPGAPGIAHINSINAAYPGHGDIATIFIANPSGEEFEKEGAANAKLIAAAPDLLDAIMTAERMLSGSEYNAAQLADAINEIRAAIKKATE